MKKVLKRLLIILLVLIIIAGGVELWQWKNIKSIMVGINEDASEIEKRRIENQANLVDEVNTYLDEPVRDMTEDEKNRLEKGEVSAADIYQKMFEEKNSEIVKDSEKKTKTKDEIISKYMSELYKLQNEFTARAEATIHQGASYYESIKSKPQDPVARTNTINHFTPIVRSLEKECDVAVGKVVENMEKELKSIDADTSIIASVKATYANEKQLKLSYYANKYLK